MVQHNAHDAERLLSQGPAEPAALAEPGSVLLSDGQRYGLRRLTQ